MSPTRLVVGQGTHAELGTLVSGLGSKVFFVYGHSLEENGWRQRLEALLLQEKLSVVAYEKPSGEPTVVMTDEAAALARDKACDCVLSVGGGAVLDLGKAVAGLVSNGGSVIEYLEGVGSGRQATEAALPHVAVPTTAGTGSEVTRNAVISSREPSFKKSYRSPTLYPRIAVLDASLGESLSPSQTAYSGMDAITQLIEAYLTRKANPLTDTLALHGLSLAIPALERVMDDAADTASRQQLLYASTLSGMCLANAGLGLAHGFASGLGALYDIPHGKVCAILLPYAMRFNRCADFPKMVTLSRLLVPEDGLEDEARVDRACARLEEMNRTFDIPATLSELRLSDEDLPRIAQASMGNSMLGNPNPVSPGVAEMLLKTMR